MSTPESNKDSFPMLFFFSGKLLLGNVLNGHSYQTQVELETVTLHVFDAKTNWWFSAWRTTVDSVVVTSPTEMQICTYRQFYTYCNKLKQKINRSTFSPIKDDKWFLFFPLFIFYCIFKMDSIWVFFPFYIFFVFWLDSICFFPFLFLFKFVIFLFYFLL